VVSSEMSLHVICWWNSDNICKFLESVFSLFFIPLLGDVKIDQRQQSRGSAPIAVDSGFLLE